MQNVLVSTGKIGFAITHYRPHNAYISPKNLTYT
jgi:hypothetical protein